MFITKNIPQIVANSRIFRKFEITTNQFTMSNLQQIQEWKDIPNYKGLYQASIFGQIRSIKGKHILHYRILKQHLNSRGYFKVVLCKSNQVKNHLVHRLIAETFIEKKESFEVVNHINHNQQDNTIVNLEWCTQKMNLHNSRTKRKLKCG